MGKNYCTIIPKVKNKEGKIVDSKLFKSLLVYTDNSYEDAKKAYLITKNDDFIRNIEPNLKKDDNGEPTITSLMKVGLRELIPDDKLLRKLNNNIGHYKKGENRARLYFYNQETYDKLAQKANKFNRSSEFKDEYVARVVTTYDYESPQRAYFTIGVYRKNVEYALEDNKKEYNEALNKRLREILAQHGVSVGVLTELEKRLNISGVTDFDTAKAAASGMVELIRLAEGIKGEKALPEEFAHVIIAMMKSNPLIPRLINTLDSKDLVKEILGDKYSEYFDIYEGNTAKLAEEAAGKLLAKHLLNNEPIVSSPYKNLLERIIEAVKNFLRSISASSIQKAMVEADKEFGKLAKEILDGNMDDAISIDNIEASGSLYQITEERVNRDRKLLKSIIANELKRLKIYKNRSISGDFDAKQTLLLDKLMIEYEDNNEIEGIYSFLENALETLEQVQNRMKKLANTPGTTLQEKASTLRDVRNYIYSYRNIIMDIRKVLVEENRYSDNRYGKRVKIVLDNASTLIDYLLIDYQESAKPLFANFLSKFMGDSIKVPFGKHKGKVITPEQLIKEAENDITFYDRWLNSMADSPDHLLRVMDQSVKKSKEMARLRTLEIKKRIEAAGLKLHQAGVTDTNWMFERDENGNLTGDYISEINNSLFKKKQKEMYKNLEAKYGKNPTGENAIKWQREKWAWYESNMEKQGDARVPKFSIYENKEFTNLSAAKKEFYNTIMNIKKELDSYLPVDYTYNLNTVKIRKDLLERVKASDSIKSGAKQLWESIKDEFIVRTDDVDFGTKAGIKDFENNKVQTLPIYYTKLKEGESENDVSTDVVSTMIAYAAMANDYDEMNKIIDILEVGREVLRGNEEIKGRKIIHTEGGKPLKEKFKIMGQTVENDFAEYGDKTHFMKRLNDFFEMQVYNRYIRDEGTFGDSNISKGKTADFINKITSLNKLAVNVLSGISNITTGKTMMRIEAFSGEFFNESNVLRADRNYGKHLPAYLGEIGKRVKSSKLALWDEMFNVMQEYEQDIRNTNFDRKAWYARMFGMNTLFFTQNAGEHWMQNRTSLALADSYKMKDKNGKTISLWDAFEVVYVQSDNSYGTKDVGLGGKLQLKEGVTKEDGTAFTQEDVIKFSNKTKALNERMHGIYNKLDKSAIQNLALGRMAIMFRKWIVPSINRRWQKASYNFELDSWTEGYYLTTTRFLKQLTKDLRNAQFNLGARWNELNKTEKANLKRAMTEVGHFLVLVAIFGLINWGDDDEDRPWLVKMTEYQARRLYTEIGVMVPTGITQIKEGLRIIKSPAAGITTIEEIIDLTKLLNPLNYIDELQSGRYKGHSTAYKVFFNSPLVPMNKTIYKGLHPEENIPFYKQ